MRDSNLVGFGTSVEATGSYGSCLPVMLCLALTPSAYSMMR